MRRGAVALCALFVVMWLGSLGTFSVLGDWATAGNIGDSFGGVSALFSGIALALAIYSMVLQQRQAQEFEQRTLQAEQRTVEVLQQQSKAIALIEQALAQQSRAIGLIEQSLAQQISAGQVSALTFMIERQERRIENLRDWGRSAFQDENHYERGIDAAKRKIQDYEQQVHALGVRSDREGAAR